MLDVDPLVAGRRSAPGSRGSPARAATSGSRPRRRGRLPTARAAAGLGLSSSMAASLAAPARDRQWSQPVSPGTASPPLSKSLETATFRAPGPTDRMVPSDGVSTVHFPFATREPREADDGDRRDPEITETELQNTVTDKAKTARRQALLHDPRPRPVRRDRVGGPRRLHPGQGEGRVRPEVGRVPEVLVADGHEHRRAEVLPRKARHARARDQRQADDRPRRRHDRRLGPRGRLLRDRRRGRHLRGRAEGDPRQPARLLQLAGLVQRRLRGEAAVLGLLHPLDRRLDGVDPRLDPPRGRHLPRRLGLGRQPLASCAPRRSSSRRAATPPARSRSCAAPTRPPARSSPAARPGARPRWSSSTSTTRTSRSSSGARRARSRRRACSRRPATTCRSTRPTGARSSTRTRTTRCASPTRSWRPPRPAPTGTSPPAPTAPSSTRSSARDLLRQMADAAWQCADPGMQYDTTINAWHTCPNSGRINASNPCSEYMHLDDSACNLASLNLMKFRREDGELDVEAFEHAVDVMFLAQEIAVGYSSYPTPEIERNAKAYRELGLGYANLGALLMARGLPYDSDEGRAYAAAITALMTGRAYRKSAEMAGRMGAVRRPPAEPRGDARRDLQAPRGRRQHRAHRVGAGRPAHRGAPGVGRGARPRRGQRLPQLAGDRARAHRDDQLHDGLRHDGGRARLLARQVEEAGRRRRADDRQPLRADGASRSSATRPRRSSRSSPSSTSATPSSARRS